MQSAWMGRYRALVAALVKHSNINTKLGKNRSETEIGIPLTANEWQVLETVIEHQHEVSNMNRLAEAIGIPQSTFSKTVKYLCGAGLVEKYQTSTNRKNVILKPTALACALYEKHAAVLEQYIFGDFFRQLEQIGDEDLQTVIHAIEMLNHALDPAVPEEEVELIKKDL